MNEVKFNKVCEIFNTLEHTSSRNEMTSILVSFYKGLSSEDAQVLSYLIQGRVAPLFVKSEFNYSEKSFVTLLEGILKRENLKENVSQKRKELGDIGDTLEYFGEKLNYETKGLTLLEVYNLLWKIVNQGGTGSVDIKNGIISETLSKMSSLEAKYFARIVCGSLRFGLNVKTLLDVFSFVIVDDKSMRDELDRAYGAYADIGYICSLVVGKKKKEVEKNLEMVKIQPGIPVLPRLVERVGTFGEVFERLGESFLVQSKYDGLRCQIHKYEKGNLGKKRLIWQKYLKEELNTSLFREVEDICEVKLFTRNLEDVTEMFPEVVNQAKSVKKSSFILDSEVLGWDFGKEKFMTFQETMQRRRKYNVKSVKEDIPVKAMVFDILYLEGVDLSQRDTEERVDILRTFDTKGSIEVEVTKEVKNLEELYNIFNEKVGLGHEGVIVKQKKGSYLPGVRNFEWIKLKKSMESKLVDSIDLVAIGYSLGSGRRSNLGIGAVLGALYDDEKNVFVGICNVGTGFNDDQLRNIFASLKDYSLDQRPKNVFVEKSLEPDVWIEPSVVFTVEADEITRKKGSKTLSLRFPRLIEWGRDKGVTEATTPRELEGMFKG